MPLDLQCPDRLTIGPPDNEIASRRISNSILSDPKFNMKTVVLYNTDVGLHNEDVFDYFLGNIAFLSANEDFSFGVIENLVSGFLGDDYK